MIKVTRLNAVTSWSRALNAARRTVGKSALKKEPSDSWKAKMLLAEHSPIRLVEYEWTWEQIPQWVTVHFVRHHIGCEKFVHTQRPDRTGSQIPRGEHLQGELNEMDMTANAHVFIEVFVQNLNVADMPILINSMKLLKNIERLNNYESTKKNRSNCRF